MHNQKYKVTCLKCKGSSKIQIVNDKDVIYIDHAPIISSRLRPDLKWGFECGSCGNDSRLAIEEKGQIGNIVQGSKETIAKLAASLKPKNENKFSMEAT